MKGLATTFFSIVAALVVLVPGAPAGTTPLSDVQLSRNAGTQQADVIERYVQTRGLAPSPEALAARTPQPDLVERYANSHASSDASGYAMSRDNAVPSEARAAANELTERYIRAYSASHGAGRSIVTRGLAPSPEALAARASRSDDGFGWDGVSVSVGLLFASFLLATCLVYAVRHTRQRYASV